jgi:hypothetical protein
VGWFGKAKAGLTLFRAWKHFEREVEMAGFKAAAFGLISAVGMALLVAFQSACPGLLDNWKEILMTGVLAGVGKFMHSERKPRS